MLMKTLFAIVLLICSFPACTFAKYVLPEQFGAKGDGISDDTRPFMEAINTGLDISLNNKTYKITDVSLKKGQKIVANQGAIILYHSITLIEGCALKNITLDGQWNTRGVTVLGNNVSITGCKFLRTKNSLSSFGGLTSALWIGKYQDLDEKIVSCKNVRIENCLFDGCEPYNLNLEDSNNSTVARCILSYGCYNLSITGCVFRNLKGLWDSDYIQLRSFEKDNNNTPFFDENPEWRGPSPPFYGICYSDAKTVIKNCTFYQADCKSSIKIMSGNVLVKNNQFVVENNEKDKLIYSVVRCHRTSNICIRNNSILIKLGEVNSPFLVSNCLNVHIDKNTVNCYPNAFMSSSIDIKYSKECIIKKNSFESNQWGAILNTEYNYYLCVEKNVFTIGNENVRNVELFVQQSNHYTYPSEIGGELNIWNNILRVMDDRYDLMNMNNQYDYPPSYKNNRLKRID